MSGIRQCVTAIAGITVITAMSVWIIGCGDSNVETVDKKSPAGREMTQQMPHDEIHGGGATTTAAGIRWSVPEGWSMGPARSMRIATYLIGDQQDADCAVFYFGPGQGGGIQANIDRWIGQFIQPDGSNSQEKAKIEKRTISGLAVTTIDLTGTYTASMGGPMSGDKEDRSGYRMLGGIIEAPEGPVFFKLTGPEGTVITAIDDFKKLVESVEKI